MKNILTLEAMAEWAEKKPSNELYYWADINVCPCGQYAREMGLSGWFEVSKPEDLSPFWYAANELALGHPRTYDAFAARLRAA